MSSARRGVISAVFLAGSVVSGFFSHGCSTQDKPSPSETGGAAATGGASGGTRTGGIGAGGTGGNRTGGSSAEAGGAGTTGGGTSVAGRGGAPSSGGNGQGGAGAKGGSSPAGDAGTGDARDGGTPADGAAPGDAGGESFPGTNNPVLSGLFADPDIIAFDGVFYIYPTTDGFANWGATSFSAFSSTNLIQWTNRGVVLNVATDLKWATGHAWAPSVARVRDTYYDYFTADNQIGVATASSPVGPFKDALGKPLIGTKQYGVTSIDPHAFIDDDGQAYLTFGNGGLRVAKLNADMISFAGTPTDITPAGSGGMVVEGSALFKRKGTYYLQWSEGDTRLATYRVAYAKASSPLGPFTRLAVILEQDPSKGILGPGGSTVLAIPARDAYYLAYHRFKIPGGDGTHRETCIDRLAFNSDGTIVPLKPTLEGLQTAVAP